MIACVFAFADARVLPCGALGGVGEGRAGSGLGRGCAGQYRGAAVARRGSRRRKKITLPAMLSVGRVALVS